MKTDHKFTPRNERERMIGKAIENGSQILCVVLNVDITLRIERMNGWARADAYHAGMWIPDKKMVKVNMRNLYGASLERILEVLGHEFRHAVQTVHKVCEDVPDDIFPCNFRWRASYLNKPVEKDARKYQKAYRDIIVNHEEFRFKGYLNEVVPGEPLRIPDHNASIARLGKPVEMIQVFRDSEETRFWFDLRDVKGNPKKWTKSVARRVWAEQSEQLRTQKFETVYRDITIEDLVC